MARHSHVVHALMFDDMEGLGSRLMPVAESGEAIRPRFLSA